MKCELRRCAGCEAFLTNVHGKTLGHVFIFAHEDSLLVDTVPGQAETILAHLDHYLVSERVILEDQTRQRQVFYLAGADSESLLQRLAAAIPDAGRLKHVRTSIDGRGIWLARADITGPDGFLIGCNADDGEAVRGTLINGGADETGADAFTAARVAWGFPAFGVDVTAANLPQEVARDRQAISFVKGCYLGQETVARIDALGHVNKTLVALRLATTTCPEAGMELKADGQVVGQVTSGALWGDSACGLAYVRRGSNEVGKRLESQLGEALIVPTPAAQ